MKKIRNNILNLSIITICIALTIVGCTVSTPTVTTQPDGTQVTNRFHSVDPRLADVSMTTEAIGAVAPQPYGWMIGALAAVATALSQGVANYKNKREAAAQKTKAEQIEDIATTIIQGVEAAGAEAKRVKESIAQRSQTDGNFLAVDALVKKELN
jgi:hypothetical protein